MSADMLLGGSHNGFRTTARGQPSHSAADQASPEHRLHVVPCVPDRAANTECRASPAEPAEVGRGGEGP